VFRTVVEYVAEWDSIIAARNLFNSLEQVVEASFALGAELFVLRSIFPAAADRDDRADRFWDCDSNRSEASREFVVHAFVR